jgi:hypothetical protein
MVQMLPRRKIIFAFLALVFGLLFPAVAQNVQSHLIVFIADDASKTSGFFVKNSKGMELSKSEIVWREGLPLYRNFILPTAKYTIGIPGPISAIEVATTSEYNTFLQLNSYTEW